MLAVQVVSWRQSVFVEALSPKTSKETEQLLKRCCQDMVEDVAGMTTNPDVMAAACITNTSLQQPCWY
jgi:hypothetical protein